ncbi:MAG: nucleoside-diphosphate kinase [Candidatus Liptonbacteria bacterium]|nr:nucleoside-diphosphate kinase [Candidatus Liptonbacteria bacterium]
MAKIHPKEEKTVVIVKPDAVKRGLTGEIVNRIERRGLKVVALTMIKATREEMDIHYPKSKEWIARLGQKTLGTYEKYGIDPREALGTSDAFEIGTMVREWILEYMTSGPVVKIVIEGIHAIDMVRKICGNTLPNLADMGTIRGDYSVDSPALANADKRAVRNLVHASESPEESANELAHWFVGNEIHSYKRAEEDVMF